MYVRNSSTEIELSKEVIHRQRISADVLASILLLFSVYNFLVTLNYERRGVFANCCARSWLTESRPCLGLKERDQMGFLILVAVSFIVIRQCLEIVELKFSLHDDVACSVLRDTKNILYAFCVSPMYITLWIRQRRFYKSPQLQHLSKTPIKILSFTVIIVMAIAEVTGIILFTVTRGYMSSSIGCVLAFSSVPKKLPGAFLLTTTITFQAILLFLFVYPLLKHREQCQTIVSDNSETMHLIKKVSVLTLITIICDGIGALISVIFSHLIISIFRQLIYDFMLLVACVCVICTFNDWKTRLLPFLTSTFNVEATLQRRGDDKPSRVMEV